MNRIQHIPTFNCGGFAMITLRPFWMGDADSLRKHLNNPDVSGRLTHIPRPYTAAHAQAWIEEMRSNRVRVEGLYEIPTRIDFAIEVGGQLAGSAAFIHIDGHKAQVSYWLGVEYRGRGIMTEALRALVAFGLQTCGLVRIYAHTSVDNPASHRVLEKAGFKFESVIEKEWLREGKFYDSRCYTIIASTATEAKHTTPVVREI